MKHDVIMTFPSPVSVIKGSSTVPSVYGNGLTDRDIRTRTEVVYPMQVNGLVPLTDTGTQTRTGVARPLEIGCLLNFAAFDKHNFFVHNYQLF